MHIVIADVAPGADTVKMVEAAGRQALGRLSALLVGGEALALPLARQLRQCVSGKLLNIAANCDL